jgi:transposase
MDLRLRVLQDCDAGLSASQAATKFRVSASWVRRLLQRRRATGETAPRPSGRRPPTWLKDAGRIRQAVADAPDLTLGELQRRLGLAISLTTLWRAVAALGLTVKKKSRARPNKTAPMSPNSGNSGRTPRRPATRHG